MENKIISHRPILAYGQNSTKFLNREFYIDKRVYVPNPETELMVQSAIEYIKSNKLEEGTFIDVGTGCGNIAISLAKAFPSANILATDISVDALDVAKINIEKHDINNIMLLNTDLVTDINTEPDLVIGNLPWGDYDHLLQTNTKEALALMPPIAIFAPDGIIGSYVRLSQQINLKNWNTVLIGEVGVLGKEIIEDNIPSDFKWDYKPIPDEFFNYSILKIEFTRKNIIHRHLIYQAEVGRIDIDDKSGEELKKFLLDLVSLINMKILIPPNVAFSHQKAWTGIVGIVTSHISFHFWTIEKQLQIDIYSCKEFDSKIAISFLNDFWKTKLVNTLFIERGLEDDFKLTKF